jgi:hypothetical protein
MKDSIYSRIFIFLNKKINYKLSDSKQQPYKAEDHKDKIKKRTNNKETSKNSIPL